MYVIAIVTGTTMMLSVLKLAESCVVYTFVMYVFGVVAGTTTMLPLLKLTNSCVV